MKSIQCNTSAYKNYSLEELLDEDFLEINSHEFPSHEVIIKKRKALGEHLTEDTKNKETNKSTFSANRKLKRSQTEE